MTDQAWPSVYDLQSVQLPYLSGGTLRLFVRLLESPLRGLLAPSLLRSAGIAALREMSLDEPPTFYPPVAIDHPAAGAAQIDLDNWPQPPAEPGPGFRFATVHDYARAYRQGAITPEEVARRALKAIDASEAHDPPLRALIAVDREDVMRQARASTDRLQAGEPLSLFDGVPVAVKDEVDMVPYPTTVGTAFLGAQPATRDATVVARMRAAGALLLGKANMHEIGIGVTGMNACHGSTRNPYGPQCCTGGSSSGPATAVAAGFCPVAIGADGGGSIRIPASFCGLVGLKPTFGRVSEHGATPLTWSMGHLGPLTTSATDAALAYAVLAGPDPLDRHSLRQPAPTLEGWQELDLHGVRLGIFWPWFRHATEEVVAACESVVRKFEAMGAELLEVVIPDLEAARVAHTLTIAAEMAVNMSATYDRHHRQHGLDVRTNLALARTFTAGDYLKAQQVRTRLIASFARALEKVDAILTPSTGLVAPVHSAAALAGEESDLTTLMQILRFTTPANLTGLPAISMPAGYSADGLPIGLQAIGRAWQEASLLRLALAAEQVVQRRKPLVHFELLSQEA
jgi:Asp-tRNA(Asn)/Glu-tRNA(Gln) amidotransferase A subunit family amidase